MENATPTPRPAPAPYWHSRGYLPHFETAWQVQMVTFRLADSVPAEVAQKLAADRDRTRNDKNYRKKVEAYLDAGHGACWLRKPALAKIAIEAIHQFDSIRYRLHAYVLMPNHIHILVEVTPPFLLSKIIQTWKSFSARRINAALHRTGPLWQADSWDRYIRDHEHYCNALEYILENPVKAGLVQQADQWPWTWVREDWPNSKA